MPRMTSSNSLLFRSVAHGKPTLILVARQVAEATTLDGQSGLLRSTRGRLQRASPQNRHRSGHAGGRSRSKSRVAVPRRLQPCSICAITGRWNEEDLTGTPSACRLSELEHVDERSGDLRHLVACELARLRSVLLFELDVCELVDVARDHEASVHGHLPA